MKPVPKITTINDRVAVLVDAPRPMAEGSDTIFSPLPFTPDRGEVISAGERCEHLESGMRVQAMPNLGTRIVFGAESVLFLKEEQVAGILL